MSYTSAQDFIRNELASAVGGVDDNFDYDTFVVEMVKAGTIKRNPATGWKFADAMNADHPELVATFWAAVKRYDAAAMEGVDPSTLRDMTDENGSQPA